MRQDACNGCASKECCVICDLRSENSKLRGKILDMIERRKVSEKELFDKIKELEDLIDVQLIKGADRIKQQSIIVNQEYKIKELEAQVEAIAQQNCLLIDKHITLEEQIERMKCCANCEHNATAYPGCALCSMYNQSKYWKESTE